MKPPSNRKARKALARVKAPLPPPTCCRYCQGEVKMVNNRLIYGRPMGEWPYAYLCQNTYCRASVSVHPFTDIPMGILADKALRVARQEAKAIFNKIWSGPRAIMGRPRAYEWLANAMGFADVEQCHVGWFDAEQCATVVAICKQRGVT